MGQRKMNEHNCPQCGRLMGIDGEEMFARGEVVFKCRIEWVYNAIIPVPEVIDVEATDRFWDEIDRVRIRENPRWKDVLLEAGLL